LEKILSYSEEISFDVETTGLDERTAQLVGICLSVEPPYAYYIPLGHLRGDVQNDAGQMNLFSGEAILAEDQLSLDVVLDSLRPFLTDPNIPKIAHNAKYDYAILEKYDIRVKPLSFDTMIGEWLTDPASKHLGLKDLTFHRLGIERGRCRYDPAVGGCTTTGNRREGPD
jgi:DNA polymerase-1